MADEEIRHLLNLREAAEGRKRARELQKQQQGINAPPEVALDIEQADLELDRIDARLRILRIDLDVQEATGQEAGLDVLRLQVKDLRKLVRSAFDQFGRESRESQREMRRSIEAVQIENRRAIEAIQVENRRAIEAALIAAKRESRDATQEARDEMRDTLIEIREESRLWRESQEDKHDRGAIRYQVGFAIFCVTVVIILMLIAWIIGRLPL